MEHQQISFFLLKPHFVRICYLLGWNIDGTTETFLVVVSSFYQNRTPGNFICEHFHFTRIVHLFGWNTMDHHGIFLFAIASKCSVTFAKILVTEKISTFDHFLPIRTLVQPSNGQHSIAWKFWPIWSQSWTFFVSTFWLFAVTERCQESFILHLSQAQQSIQQEIISSLSENAAGFAIIRSWKWFMIGMHSLEKALEQNSAEEDLSKYSDLCKKKASKWN